MEFVFLERESEERKRLYRKIDEKIHHFKNLLTTGELEVEELLDCISRVIKQFE